MPPFKSVGCISKNRNPLPSGTIWSYKRCPLLRKILIDDWGISGHDSFVSLSKAPFVRVVIYHLTQVVRRNVTKPIGAHCWIALSRSVNLEQAPMAGIWNGLT